MGQDSRAQNRAEPDEKEQQSSVAEIVNCDTPNMF